MQHPDGHMLPFSQVGNTITSVLQDVKQAAEQLQLKANITHVNAVEGAFEKSLLKFKEEVARERGVRRL